MIDIETSPLVAHVWGLFKQNVSLSQLRESTHMICFAAKWYGQKKAEFYSVHTHGKELMLKRAWELMDEADAIIHYNGSSFDIPHLNREFLEAQLMPPSPSKQIDLYRVAKKQFRFPSNKLQYISTTLGLAGKTQHSGHDLWVKCMAGDAQAWKMMEKYNKQDVHLLGDVYDALLPWITNHPNQALYGGEGCPNCGTAEHLVKRGFAYTSLGKFQRYCCGGCGSWSRSSRRLDGVELQGIL